MSIIRQEACSLRKIFLKHPLQLAKFLALLTLSLVLLIYDRDLDSFKKLRTGFLPLVVAPFYQIINWPISTAKNVLNNLSLKRQLVNENEYLRSQLLLNQVSLQKLQALEQENIQLHALLKSAVGLKQDFLAAKFTKFNILDRGRLDSVFIGQSVVDAYGLIGQVILVEKNLSKVLLVSDVKSAIPAMIVRSGVQVIAIGLGDRGNLGLVNISETMDIKEGDLLVTSSRGERFPSGIAIGKITAIEHIPGNRFVKVSASINAHVGDSKNVLLVK